MGDNFVCTKKPTERTLTDSEKEAIHQVAPGLLDKAGVKSVQRVERYNAVFDTHTPDKSKRHRDCFISYLHEGSVVYGVIQTFVQVRPHNGEEQSLALIHPFQLHDVGIPFATTPQKYFTRMGTTKEELKGHITNVIFQE